MIYGYNISHAKLHKETTECHMLFKLNSFAMWLWLFGCAHTKQFFAGIPSESELKGLQKLSIASHCNSFYLKHKAWFHWVVSAGRTSLNHSTGISPGKTKQNTPCSSVNMVQAVIWIWGLTIKPTQQEMWKITRDHSKQWYLWNNKFFLDSVYKHTLLIWVLQQWPTFTEQRYKY